MVIEIKDLSFRYDKSNVLSGISLSGRPGRVISILGPNGAGKSTLLKCISRLVKVSENSIFINQKDINLFSRNELAKHIGYLPQILTSTHICVYDAILIGRRPYINWSLTKEDHQIVNDLITSMNLEPLAMRYIDELSGGERQKVHIARVIAQKPKIMLLDEPINNLDISNQWKFMNLIIDLARSRNICTFITLHDINTAIHFSDDLVFLKEGKIVKISNPTDVDKKIIKNIYDIDVDVVAHNSKPYFIPIIK